MSKEMEKATAVKTEEIDLEQALPSPIEKLEISERDFILKYGKPAYDVILYLYKSGKANLFVMSTLSLFIGAFVTGNLTTWEHFSIVCSARMTKSGEMILQR